MPLVRGKAMVLLAIQVAKVPTAPGTQDLPSLPVRIHFLTDGALHIGPKARPPTAAVKLHPAGVERPAVASGPAAGAHVSAWLEMVVKPLRKLEQVARLGGLAPQDLVLFFRQNDCPFLLLEVHVLPQATQVRDALLLRHGVELRSGRQQPAQTHGFSWETQCR